MLDINQKQKVAELLGSALGAHVETAKDNIKFYCPFCKHHNRKLEVNLDSQKWRCWVCDDVRGKSILQLFKKIGLDTNAQNVARDIYKDHTYVHKESPIHFVRLPNEFQQISKYPKGTELLHVIKFLRGRGVSRYDICKYNIGFADSGLFRNMIIFPSYDENGSLNYYTGRSFYDDGFRNPEMPRDVIGFDAHINWDYPITLVEAPLDAIAVRINSIPLFGTYLSKKLKEKISNKRPEVNIFLDPDAIKMSIKHCEYLLDQGIKTKLIMSPLHDPNKLGFTECWKLINSTKYFEFGDLVKLKILC